VDIDSVALPRRCKPKLFRVKIDCHPSSRLAEHAGELPNPHLSEFSALRFVTSLASLRLHACAFPRKPAGDTAILILIAFITGNSSLEPLCEVLCAQIHVNLR